MWQSGWLLIPTDQVALLTGATNEDDAEPRDYPWVGFPDGEVEGSDLNNLWLLVGDSEVEKPLCGQPLLDGPDGSQKIAPVSQEAAEAFAALPESRIGELAAAWQQAKSETSSLSAWKLEDIAEAIRELKFLARLHRNLEPDWELLMVWWL